MKIFCQKTYKLKTLSNVIFDLVLSFNDSWDHWVKIISFLGMNSDSSSDESFSFLFLLPLLPMLFIFLFIFLFLSSFSFLLSSTSCSTSFNCSRVFFNFDYTIYEASPLVFGIFISLFPFLSSTIFGPSSSYSILLLFFVCFWTEDLLAGVRRLEAWNYSSIFYYFGDVLTNFYSDCFDFTGFCFFYGLAMFFVCSFDICSLMADVTRLLTYLIVSNPLFFSPSYLTFFFNSKNSFLWSYV